MQKTNNLLVPFVNESDGLKRFALIWQLLMNECINKNSVIFWDEPENSINPLNIPLCVDILLELQRHGVQIFVSTHSYTLARYFELIKNNNDTIRYHSLYKDNDGFIKNSYAEEYVDIVSYSIEDAGQKLFYDVVQKAMDGAEHV